ncbi:hypothetical protein EYF80_056721 [Liparis tanakae]|uniref:Uncharacterized protein n=1 Tax=Liparis tanakae TaxID=230148 RepID=A0A4Z2EXP9_9TELE|nr:hypothetical protein EYF80_056721 [Liparis tanakae]
MIRDALVIVTLREGKRTSRVFPPRFRETASRDAEAAGGRSRCAERRCVRRPAFESVNCDHVGKPVQTVQTVTHTLSKRNET